MTDDHDSAPEPSRTGSPRPEASHPDATDPGAGQPGPFGGPEAPGTEAPWTTPQWTQAQWAQTPWTQSQWAEPEDHPSGPSPGHAPYTDPDPHADAAPLSPHGQELHPGHSSPPQQGWGGSSTTWLVALAACTAVIAVGALAIAWFVPGRDATPAAAQRPPAATATSAPDAESTGAGVEAAPSQGSAGAPASPLGGGTAVGSGSTTAGGPAPAPTGSSARTPPAPAPAPSLSRPPGAALQVDLRAPGPAAVQVTETLAAHGDAINTADYTTGWAQQSPALQTRNTSQDSWSQGLATTEWQQLTVREVTTSGSTATADTRLRTTQDPEWGNGHACLDWALTYTLVRGGDGWLIDRARGSSTPC